MQKELFEMRVFYESGQTRSPAFRHEQLLKLKTSLIKYEQEVYKALYADLRKSKEEVWVTELGFVIAEINFLLKNLRSFMKPKKVSTNLANLPSSSYVVTEPLGVVLIIAPWNYPLNLLITPLAGAIASGNCAVSKASEFAPESAAILKIIIEETFDRNFIHFVEGDGATIVPEMINVFRFDHIFYTGSTAVGKKIYQAAAEYLIPVTLELGGKSPCIVEKDADLKVAARRISLAKFSNSGQTCVAPDYLLVHNSVKEDLIAMMITTLSSFYQNGAEGETGSIINKKHFHRLEKFLSQGEIVSGGHRSEARLYIEPTLMVNVPWDSDIMKEEIFGPLLPIFGFETFEEAKLIVEKNPDPLALYIFSSDSNIQKRYTEEIAFGGGCINNAGWHLTNYHLPFGGRGNSGFGSYHGRGSFEVFSHRKAIMKTATWFDPKIKYPPFAGKLSLLKKLIR